jgi:SAM-dependent methyltransferase
MMTMDGTSSVEGAAWPPSELEHVGRCPACGDPARSLMFDDMTDLSFGVAPGRWSLWRCGRCRVAYLDPRPNEASIGRAYDTYYTHEAPSADGGLATICGPSLKSRLRAGYYNHAFGHRLKNGLAVGRFAGVASPRKKAQMDHLIRHLPPPSSKDARFLDLGCGNGAFLGIARALGYTAMGLEPDPKVVATARSTGLDVRQGLIPGSGLPENSFDQITLSHVFEHLHRPQDACAELLRILKPGGRVWFSQPNLGAIGRETFGKYWRGFETPRHLCLFEPDSFMSFLSSAGFQDIRLLAPQPCAINNFRASVAMMAGEIPQKGVTPKGWGDDYLQKVRLADDAAMRRAEKGEAFTVVASRARS